MPRKKRIWYPGATYHVMSRGNRRSLIYKNQTDYTDFLNIIRIISEEYPFKVHSICLMSNHYHMAVETGTTELWRIMQKILSIYAGEFNHRHGYNGHLFESRYTAKLIEDEQYFLEVSRYIHLNPVKAQTVREPLAYEYSRYGAFMDNRDSTNGLERRSSAVLSLKVSCWQAVAADINGWFLQFQGCSPA